MFSSTSAVSSPMRCWTSCSAGRREPAVAVGDVDDERHRDQRDRGEVGLDREHRDGGERDRERRTAPGTRARSRGRSGSTAGRRSRATSAGRSAGRRRTPARATAGGRTAASRRSYSTPSETRPATSRRAAESASRTMPTAATGERERRPARPWSRWWRPTASIALPLRNGIATVAAIAGRGEDGRPDDARAVWAQETEQPREGPHFIKYSGGTPPCPVAASRAGGLRRAL